MKNLTIAITIQGANKNLIGPKKGCPILYTKGSDTKIDAHNVILSSEFFAYLLKNGCFNSVEEYSKTKIYFSEYYIDGDTQDVKSDSVLLQNFWTLEDLYKDENKFPWLACNCLDMALQHIYTLCYPGSNDMFNGNDISDLHNENTENSILSLYCKLKDKYKDKLNKPTFINAILSYFQRREEVNLSKCNIDYLLNVISGILRDAE